MPSRLLTRDHPKNHPIRSHKRRYIHSISPPVYPRPLVFPPSFPVRLNNCTRSDEFYKTPPELLMKLRGCCFG